MGLLDPRPNFRPFEYERAYEFAKAQADHHWTHSEIEVDSDVMQYHTSFTKAEKHGITTASKLFTLYETSGAANYWLDTVYPMFNKPEIRLMCQAFGAQEGEHALFYDKFNNAIGLSTKDFYLSFLDDPAMKQRMQMIDYYLELGKSNLNKNKALSLAAFSFVEGVVLYSSFAFFMSFQQPPKNKLKNTGTGLAYSVRDEALHADADSWLCNTFMQEYGIEQKDISSDILELAKNCVELEGQITDSYFSEGPIEGITADQMKVFVRSRADKKLGDIGLEAVYNIEKKDNPISSWFYKSINSIEFSDFFDRNSTAYSKHWNFKKIGKY